MIFDIVRVTLCTIILILLQSTDAGNIIHDQKLSPNSERQGGSKLENNVDSIFDISCATYTKINPSIYFVEVSCESNILPINFIEQYHKGWKLYIPALSARDGNGQIRVSVVGRKLVTNNGERKDKNTSYSVQGDIGPSISGTILLTDNIHVRLKNNFNGWLITNEIIEEIIDNNTKERVYIKKIDGRFVFNIYVVYYGEVIRRVFRGVSAIGIALMFLTFCFFGLKRRYYS